jgi:hypothetical protein
MASSGMLRRLAFVRAAVKTSNFTGFIVIYLFGRCKKYTNPAIPKG